MPVLEKRFRVIPNVRDSLRRVNRRMGMAALQIFQRPDFFGGAWCMYPDPVDFHRNQLVDLYGDTNAFVPNGATATGAGALHVTLAGRPAAASPSGS